MVYNWANPRLQTIATTASNVVTGYEMEGLVNPTSINGGGQERIPRSHTRTTWRMPKAVAETTAAIARGITSATDAVRTAVGTRAIIPKAGCQTPHRGAPGAMDAGAITV
jgi:hypothetical protein